jgi:hypothetical protein
MTCLSRGFFDYLNNPINGRAQMRITNCILGLGIAALIAGCESKPKEPKDLKQFDFRGAKLGESFSAAAVGKDPQELDGSEYFIEYVSFDGSEASYDDDDMITVIVSSLATKDEIGSISWNFPSDRFETVVELAVGKLGEPHDREVDTVSNAMGAQFQQVSLSWYLPNGGTCFATNMAGAISKGSLMATTPAWSEETASQSDVERDKLQQRL